MLLWVRRENAADVAGVPVIAVQYATPTSSRLLTIIFEF
jgi:hypothetical protein